MPSCSAIDLAEIRRSSKIRSCIWSIISWVVTVLGRLGRGASQVERSPCLNWTTQFLTVAYDGACSRNVSFRMAWISFGTLPCRKTILMTPHVSMLLKSPEMLPFSLCNKKRLAIRHMNRLLFPTTLSIPSYSNGEVGRAKDLSATPCRWRSGPYIWSVFFGMENLLPLPGVEQWYVCHPAHSLITVLTAILSCIKHCINSSFTVWKKWCFWCGCE